MYHNRISNGTFWAMIGVTLVFEFASLIPGVNFFSGILSSLVFPIWFWLKGASYSKNKKLVTNFVVAFFIELIPVVSMLPATLFAVWRNARAVQKEDIMHNNKIDSMKLDEETRQMTAQLERRQLLMRDKKERE